MPTYCYRRMDNEEPIELVMSIHEMQARQNHLGIIKLDDGVYARRDIAEEHRSAKSFPGNWPILSDAIGVMPEQVKEAREESIRQGVPTEFTPDGRAILRSPAHRKAYCEANGFYDRNAGYGDPTPKRKFY